MVQLYCPFHSPSIRLTLLVAQLAERLIVGSCATMPPSVRTRLLVGGNKLEAYPT
ncbi:hypothetical protein EGR_03147 [Echinococcus granulosus]|uniref:Uncharacterized protein n=1 Tax=Echinococcus granulosus TaxID=6210 RepID=W6V645_ECHGR|nr:hypothetical protein EGR_03147 [Echinococcus granulosus]EUB61874.1 hypothetical protein EGR_03147 [Echinococcus granulosus]